MKVIGNWQIENLSESARFLLYAGAYLQAARSVCLRMHSEEEQNTWPNATVALFLSAHSVELFLKGAIVSRNPKALANIHHIGELTEKYFALLPEPDFAFDVPFQYEYLGFPESDISTLQKNDQIHSILFRYPIKSHGIEWQGVHGFEVEGFLELISELEETYSRIGRRI